MFTKQLVIIRMLENINGKFHKSLKNLSLLFKDPKTKATSKNIAEIKGAEARKNKPIEKA